MSHYDDFETVAQAERRRQREKEAHEFNVRTHTEPRVHRGGTYTSELVFRVCTDCKALTFDAEGHRGWHEENNSWL